MKRILFVCLGNICRSPAAEGILKKMAVDNCVESKVFIDSAGTSGHHDGDPADARMIEHAKKRGYELTSISRQFTKQDFDSFDLILTMDSANLRDIKKLDPKGTYAHKVKPVTEFCRIHQLRDVPDPYYSGADGFELVLDILEDACEQLIRSC
jgi:protein-tyrosine phosphatase